MRAKRSIQDADVSERTAMQPQSPPQRWRTQLVAAASRVLKECPWLRVPIADDMRDKKSVGARLDRLFNLRLQITQRGANPLLAGRAHHSASRALVCELQASETKLLAVLRCPQTRLRYQTAALLHPNPWQEQARYGAEMASLQQLNAAWTELRAKRPRRAWFREKLRQNADFFRHGAALPFYWLRRRRIRRLVPASVMRHPTLRETFFAIEQIGPIVDNFAFHGRAGLPFNDAVAVSDLVFLYMQLGDAVVDQMVQSAGHDAVVTLLERFEGLGAGRRHAYPLEQLSGDDLAELGLSSEAFIARFNISAGDLLSAMQDLKRTLRGLLAETNRDLAGEVAGFLQFCFWTYLDELHLGQLATHTPDRLPLQCTAWHFYRKNNLVMMHWLALRARLQRLKPARHTNAIRRWGYLLASFQIFDDLKDVALDHGLQPSYPLQLAANQYPQEYDWLAGRLIAGRQAMQRDQVPEVQLRAPQTVMHCIELSRLMALAHFDYALIYAWDQRWRRSWTERHHSFNPGPARDEHDLPVLERLFTYFAQTMPLQAQRHADDAYLAHILDTVAYDHARALRWRLWPQLRRLYRFTTLRMWMSPAEKSAIVRQLIRQQPKRAAQLIRTLPASPLRARLESWLPTSFVGVGLANVDVHHQVTGDSL